MVLWFDFVKNRLETCSQYVSLKTLFLNMFSIFHPSASDINFRQAAYCGHDSTLFSIAWLRCEPAL